MGMAGNGTSEVAQGMELGNEGASYLMLGSLAVGPPTSVCETVQMPRPHPRASLTAPFQHFKTNIPQTRGSQ